MNSIINCTSLEKIIESKQISSDDSLNLSIYQEGVNLILDVIDTKHTINDSRILKYIKTHNIISSNITINLYNRFNLLCKIEDKLSLIEDDNSLYKLYVKVRKSGGNLLLDKNIYSAAKFSIMMPIIDNMDMFVVKAGTAMYALPSEFILNITGKLENKQYKDVILLDNIIKRNDKENLIHNYNEVIAIDFKRKTIPIAVDKIIGFKSLSINTLPFPITYVEGIDAAGLTTDNDIVFIISISYLFNIYTSSI
jgi:hypothetical protein